MHICETKMLNSIQSPMENKSYNWKFASVGGEVRVKITSGEDIAHLGELDKKMWTVLSSPVQGLEFDQKFLDLLDTNKDGKIRTEEVIAAGKYVTDVIKNKDLVLNGDSSLPLSEFNEESEEGKKLHDSAVQILKNLKLEKDSIALEDTEDNTKIFAESKFNGDGITLSPGWKCVPRCLTMIEPAVTDSPAYFLTPRCFGLESRPFFAPLPPLVLPILILQL